MLPCETRPHSIFQNIKMQSESSLSMPPCEMQTLALLLDFRQEMESQNCLANVWTISIRMPKPTEWVHFALRPQKWDGLGMGQQSPLPSAFLWNSISSKPLSIKMECQSLLPYTLWNRISSIPFNIEMEYQTPLPYALLWNRICSIRLSIEMECQSPLPYAFLWNRISSIPLSIEMEFQSPLPYASPHQWS